MKPAITTILLSILLVHHASASTDSTAHHKKRLDFARTYFETGGTLFSSFQGKGIVGDKPSSFRNPASLNHYLNWGAMHFWGHAEFYVTIPLNQFRFQKNDQTDFELTHSVATGFRLLPWAYTGSGLRPYIGASWASLDFRQKIKPDENQTRLSKDFMLNAEAGVLYAYRSFGLRAGVHYLPQNKWDYPISRTQTAMIKLPSFAFQVGLLYTFESSGKQDQATQDKWNGYPRVSRQSLKTDKPGTFFIAAGPSLSFSLGHSAFNRERFPYLKSKMASGTYFDLSAGYHLYHPSLFAALSFRNPKFKTEGYGAEQTIRKTSIALEVNKFLTDYTGFAPYVGLNLAYDHFRYSEKVDKDTRKLSPGSKFEPGITFGWDIQPGKNDEALILRTNLRWYPLASFAIDGKKFDFRQLEYNLIQVVLYPGRLHGRRLQSGSRN